MPRLKIIVAAAIAATVPAAQAATEDALAACRAIKDGGARLACYDGLPLGTPAARTPAAPLNGAPRSPAASDRAPAPAEASTFGLPATTRPAPVESLETRIDGHFAGWYAGSRIELANGQVWQVTDGTSRFADVDSPKVTVRRGALGSFFLDIDGVNPAPRVKRVK